MIKKVLTGSLMVWMLSSTLLFSQAHQSAPMNDKNYPENLQYLELEDGYNIAYTDEGEGEYTLLMIHGLGSYMLAWNKLVDELSGDFRCVRLDLPGYGRSSGGDFAYDMSFFGKAVADFAKAKKLKNIVLVGHSMGGQIALKMAIDKHLPVQKLVLLAPAGLETFSDEQKAWFKQFTTPAIIKMANEQQIKNNFGLNFYGGQLPEDAHFMYEDRLDMRAQEATYSAYAEMIPKCVMGMLNEEVYPDLSKVSQETLVIYGENDALIPNKLLHPNMTSAQVADLAKAIPQVSIKLLAECGHFVQWDQATKTATLIREHLK
ncbi:MAG: alpha/beta hydrolase [Saprospiraceae bacterium]|nr:alpha/beta hydrolase [Saprospiraceae bacterium]